jgi:aryl-alcohol dehydrogenase-like predicted oxidoreductase
VITYFSLAAGFLTGKYRDLADVAGRAREKSAGSYITPRNLALLDVIEAVARDHGATMAQVAIAWLMNRPSVTAPIASATSLPQLEEILVASEILLSAEDLLQLDEASRPDGSETMAGA